MTKPISKKFKTKTREQRVDLDGLVTMAENLPAPGIVGRIIKTGRRQLFVGVERVRGQLVPVVFAIGGAA
ncbi:hypothetical protein W911_00265 [Hyphomicrobium nitrativorans NL23]|uniref:Uncharacterized protein n=1 Tax=Hyphomicrobium nitrativorans NL23 TaxID=1029756 RepID=V5SH16_9HYPH|nr:hypothetical protein [Hyphomicrobium nitrativorans]AHB49787.1 hypothetical protein W911_00265 [Hyphomicrobium nitrativorans NL23]